MTSRKPVGIGGAYIFELGAGDYSNVLKHNPEALPTDCEVDAVWRLVERHGAEYVIEAAHREHREAAVILVNFSTIVKGA